MNCGNILRDLTTNLIWKHNQGNILTIYWVKRLSIGQSAAKLLKVYKSMEKVQRIDIEVIQPIIYPRASDISTEMMIYAGLHGNMQKYGLKYHMITKSKTVGRDADLILGVFAPNRYEIPDYRGYDISKLKDNYRCAIILKSRDGEANIRGHLFFDGAVTRFEELPKAADMSQEQYEYYANKVNRSCNTITFS